MIQFQDVSFSYGKEDGALDHISFSAQKGEVILLCGESGCGKTTITRCINGLIPHYYEGTMSGTVSVDSKNPAELPLYDLTEFVGSVFQNPKSQFFNVDTTSELAFACENMGMPVDEIKTRLRETAKKLHIEHLLGRSIFELSGGEKQKIACGGVSMLSPDCIVMDEPTSNLDVPSIYMLKEIISYWKSQGKTIVIAEHRLWFLKDLADRVIFLEKGKIIENFNGKEFFNKAADFYSNRGLRNPKPPSLIFPKESVDEEYLSIRNLSFSYKKVKQILDIPEMKIALGQITAIVGANGAGKSTLVNCLCGLNKHDPSVLSLGSENYKRKKRLNLCFPVMQDVNHQLFTESVLDEVLLSMENEDEDRAKEILKAMDLETFADSHPLSLSGGQKQRVAISSALASEREILIFDEPTSGLDYKHMMAVASEIKKLKAMGKTIILVTHDAEFINSCCDHILTMKSGELVNFDNELLS